MTVEGRTFTPGTGGVVNLNYYDGRFLRADDLNLERDSQREYVELSNRTTASGVAFGFGVTGFGGGVLHLSAGLAKTPRGQILHLPDDVSAAITDLLGPAAQGGPQTGGKAGFAECAAAPAAAPAAGVSVAGTALYEICLRPAATLTGTGEVFGRVCSGCGTTTDSPYRADGVTLLLRPLTTDVQPWTVAGVTRPETHLRSQVASSRFAAERAATGRIGAALLGSTLWRAGAAPRAGDDTVAVGVLGWDGTHITLLDRWTACREAFETPPAGYWAGQLEQRPGAVFLAQVLQFQDQLSAAPPAPGGSAQELIDRGFVELPPAGYLAVPPATSDLRDRLAGQFGPGVRLWLCAVRRDQIPHELDRAQHMDRISLLRGLRDETAREEIDILVPDGTVTAARGGLGFAVDFALGDDVRRALDEGEASPRGTLRGQGAARVEVDSGFVARGAVSISLPQNTEALTRLLSGEEPGRAGFDSFLSAIRTASPVTAPSPAQLRRLVDLAQTTAVRARTRRRATLGALPAGNDRLAAAWLTLAVRDDPFGWTSRNSTGFSLDIDVYRPAGTPTIFSLRVFGTLTWQSASAGETVVVASGGFGLSAEGPDGAGSGGSFEGRRLRLARTTQDGVTLTVQDEETGLTADLHIKGDPIRAEATVDTRPAEGSTPTAGVVAVQEPAIGDPGNLHHQSAAAALALLGGIHTDPEWAPEEYQRLFPAGDRPTATVRATQDWVLFRRRRRESCEGDPITPVTVDTVTVQVLTRPDLDRAQQAAQILLTGEPGDWPGDWKATEVVFEGGRTTLLTPGATWQQHYRAAGGASAVALAGYAAAPGTSGLLVGPGRLRALLSALPPDVTPDPSLPVVPVTPPPALQGGAGLAGSAFLITYAAGAPTVRSVAVKAILTSEATTAATGAIHEPDPALDTDDAAFAALGEGDTGGLDADRVIAQLDAFRASNKLEAVEIETVLWTHDALDEDDRKTMLDLAGQLQQALAGRPEVRRLTRGEAHEVAFDREDAEPVAFVFLLVSAPAA
ncbi:hypothetical protein [Paractinoplanes maris]|uniref:hypothetical protein n=1 Tax=Paractinoplanes maris TaxID=1734446 RepID=UPI00202278BA|nr:hypothetical protein [Actinoplanes maris]